MAKIDNYAGDAAWAEWFELCSVSRCKSEHSIALTEQIRASMFAQLARFGYSADIVGDDDPISCFDAYFMAYGSRDKSKPLKSYFRFKMSECGARLREFVCGTFFSARYGRIHDIVRDWIASAKGWKPHSLVGDDGKRHLVWESAAAKEDVREFVGGYVSEVGARLDIPVLRGYAFKMIEVVAQKIKVEKSKVAFLLIATAKGLPMSSPEVLEKLGVKKSRAAKIKEECMKQVERFFAASEVRAGDIQLARAVIAACEMVMGEEVCHD